MTCLFGNCLHSIASALHPPSVALIANSFPTFYTSLEWKHHEDGSRTLILSPKNGDSSLGCYPVGHSPTCPALLAPVSSPLPHQFVRIAVCIMVEHDGHVLLERRAAHMRTFPRRWVLPGGHVDPGEALVDAAVRELYEEVGLKVDASQLELFALWESCYPTQVEQGSMQRQHLIFYFRSVLQASQPRPHLKLQPQEVDMAAWVPVQGGNLIRWICGDVDLSLVRHTTFPAYKVVSCVHPRILYDPMLQ